MKILLLSEGKNELGVEHPRNLIDSPLREIVRRLLGFEAPPLPSCEDEAAIGSRARLSSESASRVDDGLSVEIGLLSATHFRGKPIRIGWGIEGGFERKLIAWLREGELHQFDAVIVVADEDGDRRRIVEFDAAQNCDVHRVPRAFGIAVRSFDAWMLADEAALSAVLGRQVQRQPDPESDRDPKRRCHGLLANCGRQMTPTEMYLDVARAINLEILEQRCRKGFKPFADRVRAVRA